MTARNHAIANLVADALVERLRLIGRSNDAVWLTTPKTVDRGMAVDAVNLPKPGLFLITASWGPSERHHLLGGALTARCVAKYTVLMLTDEPVTSRRAEEQLCDMAADVMLAIETDYQLDHLLDTGWVHVEGYTPEVELSGGGFATASVELTATWLWTTDSP
jgi:hypothetical protein